MPRPKKWRRVASIPKTKVFGPFDDDKEQKDIVIMNVEEFESIRLMDLKGLDQSECAKKMAVARTTFQRIYKDAKRKMADVVVNGKVLKIEGGNYALNQCCIKCENCGFIWNKRYEEGNNQYKCPKCGYEDKHDCMENEFMEICRDCKRHRHRGK
ncbi:DUF134 domain-containing protein [Marinisporobacter balticus]|uniref:UPF0251 protein EV214_11216 n=1 Tax=Marinisporobacter balticus TaxID=2018667 RepID=A0A4V2SB86_9FIRM|nr:DUF134 domain-containing protein [Marinisporobacter balticus]TCO74540.1 putative DNA-binding protein (UPF0251 family) [Marinisporobacter balticus]